MINGMWLSRDCEQVIGLFEIIEGGGVRDEVVKGGEVIGGVNIGVLVEVIGVDRGIINGVVDRNITGATKGLTIGEL